MQLKMHPKFLAAIFAVGAAFSTSPAIAQPAPAAGPHMKGAPMMMGHGPAGSPMMGPGMMSHGMMGPGMMGPNGCPGCGMMWGQQRANLNLSAADVKINFEQWLTWRGNRRLRIGQVKELNADTVTADIVAGDNTLVERYAVDRHTGFYRPIE